MIKASKTTHNMFRFCFMLLTSMRTDGNMKKFMLSRFVFPPGGAIEVEDRGAVGSGTYEYNSADPRYQ